VVRVLVSASEEYQGEMQKRGYGEKMAIQWDTVWSRIHEIHEHVKIDIYKYIYTYIIAICINMPIDFLCSEILILHPQNHH
jgi:hypothetical protein